MPEQTPPQAAAPTTAEQPVGSEWVVEAGKDDTEVTFVSPSGDERIARAKTRGGKCTARLVLTEPGEWTAHPGDHAVTATAAAPASKK